MNDIKHYDWTNWKGVAPSCHTGNTLIHKSKNGGSLYIGGWNNEASFDWNTHVIDLTGNEHKNWDTPLAYDERSKDFLKFMPNTYAGWLSLPFPDFNVPAQLNTLEQWTGIKDTIESILKDGKDVLVACHGGHGRSGLFCAIVGYMLNVNTDRSWSSPVEKIRKIHCASSVETITQENFVYKILGLSIKITHTYVEETKYTYESCPICSTKSTYIKDFGMCLTCKDKNQNAPVRRDLTIDDVKNNKMAHVCDVTVCMGIWKAEICGHVTHNMIVYDGLCEVCYKRMEDDAKYVAAKVGSEWVDEDGEIDTFGACTVCSKESLYGHRFGVCYECSEYLTKMGAVDEVHNSITDPYKAVPHSCDETGCIGVVKADCCGHVVHNKEIEDGICPFCWEIKDITQGKEAHQ